MPAITRPRESSAATLTPRSTSSENGTDYYNCGAWIDEHLTYITVGEDGVQIHEYQGRADATEKDSTDENLADSELFDFGDEIEAIEDGEYHGVAS